MPHIHSKVKYQILLFASESPVQMTMRVISYMCFMCLRFKHALLLASRQRHHHKSQGGLEGLLGEYAKSDIPFKEGGRAKAAGNILQRGHAQVSGKLRHHSTAQVLISLTINAA